MKKIYINPTVRVHVLKPLCLLAGSPDGVVNGLDPNNTVGAGDIDARGYDFDDYEDE